MTTVRAYLLIALILFSIPGFTSEYINLNHDGQAATFHKLGKVTLLFVTRPMLDKLEPVEVANVRASGFWLHGLFKPESNKRSTVLIVVDDPKIWDAAFVAKAVRMFGHMLENGEVLEDMGQFSPTEWDRVGVFYHELCHLCDHRYLGHPLTMLHALWPKLVADPGAEKLVNPWNNLRFFWPKWCTHPGMDTLDYSHIKREPDVTG